MILHIIVQLALWSIPPADATVLVYLLGDHLDYPENILTHSRVLAAEWKQNTNRYPFLP